MNDISSKFARGAGNAPDMSPADFMARKSVVDQIADWCEANADKPEKVYKNEWAPILYQYEARNQVPSPCWCLRVCPPDREVCGQAGGAFFRE